MTATTHLDPLFEKARNGYIEHRKNVDNCPSGDLDQNITYYGNEYFSVLFLVDSVPLDVHTSVRQRICVNTDPGLVCATAAVSVFNASAEAKAVWGDMCVAAEAATGSSKGVAFTSRGVTDLRGGLINLLAHCQNPSLAAKSIEVLIFRSLLLHFD